jgi:hypothetical protein
MHEESPDPFDSLSRRKRTHPTSTDKRVTPQERDLLWFQKIHGHGPLSSSYLHAFSKHLRRNEKRAKDRLTDLFNESRTPHDGTYLTRPSQQFRTLDSRYNDLVYDLTDAANAALKERGLWQDTATGRAGPWLHGFMVSCITASIELATLDRDDIRYIPQAEILARAGTELRYPTTIEDPATGKAARKDLIPDALFGLEYTVNGESLYRFYLVEADRGTEPATSANFNRKSHHRSILQYRDYIRRGHYKDHLGLTASLLVLNVMTDAAKLRKMIALTQEVSGDQGNTFMLFQLCKSFGPVFKPPKPMPELLEGSWSRAGQDEFRIGKP